MSVCGIPKSTLKAKFFSYFFLLISSLNDAFWIQSSFLNLGRNLHGSEASTFAVASLGLFHKDSVTNIAQDLCKLQKAQAYPKAILICLASANFLQNLDMGKDNRLIERGKCKVEDCDCEEFELNDDTSCKYCGDPPAKKSGHPT